MKYAAFWERISKVTLWRIYTIYEHFSLLIRPTPQMISMIFDRSPFFRRENDRPIAHIFLWKVLHTLNSLLVHECPRRPIQDHTKDNRSLNRFILSIIPLVSFCMFILTDDWIESPSSLRMRRRSNSTSMSERVKKLQHTQCNNACRMAGELFFQLVIDRTNHLSLLGHKRK